MINNLVVDYNKSTKINNIEYSAIESINTFTKRIKFYNPEVSEPLHKFWYMVGNAKIIKKNQNILSIALSSTDTKLIESIKNLDEKVNNIGNSDFRVFICQKPEQSGSVFGRCS